MSDIDRNRVLPLKEIIEERKEVAVNTLSDSYAKNRLPLEEYERLIEYINKIESERELVVVEKIVAEYRVSEKSDRDDDRIHRDDDYDDEIDSYDQHNYSDGNVSIFSSRTFSGPVKSGQEMVSIFGSGIIKIRKEDLSKRRTVLNIVSIFGESVILVEPGIRVINRAVPILGSSRVNRAVSRKEGEAELVIKGAAIFGEINIKPLKD